VIVACMVALYLSKDAARAPDVQPGSRRILEAGGSLSRALLPVLRIWRILNSQRSAT
jgi:tetraprenyl-beta-curcumene synthase